MEEKRKITHEIINALVEQAKERSTKGYKALSKLRELTEQAKLTNLQRKIFFLETVHESGKSEICKKLRISERKREEESNKAERKLIK